ncbi:MAG: zinc ribbon domain-containing protein [Chloroflexi bacterium]|nr:zinc ribbon domain-containing protein [Chloroflexota bacterium]
MPYYDYKCSACGHCFEVKQGFEEEPVAACPSCQARAQRLLHAPPIIFKGSGFYVTDQRKGPSEEKPKETKPDNGKPATPEAKKDDGVASKKP